jgi:CubicO group peptidase (beta-lactamase class C family)
MHDGALFRLASLSKSIVSFAALMQVDEGLLALDAPIGDYLPVLDGLRMKSGGKPRRAPTVRDLMRHRASPTFGNPRRRTARGPQNDFAGQMPFSRHSSRGRWWRSREAFATAIRPTCWADRGGWMACRSAIAGSGFQRLGMPKRLRVPPPGWPGWRGHP